ncbi:MAG: helix-turn-helix transcriptional regulator [Bacteroidales bacterium]|nr:helix-turn-helix transcriptional regulator [Bacteroidales bacterium]
MELRIKDILKERGLSIKDVADKIGMDASNLNSSLKKGNPKLSTLVDVANAIGCDITELFKPNEETVNAPKGGSQPLVLIDGEAYRLTKAKDVVKLPVYTDYAELRSNLKGFVQRAEKVDRKNRLAKEEKEKDIKPFSMMGMVETFEVFSLVFIPEPAVFYLTLCYKNGKFETYTYDARYEFNNAKADDGSWDTELLYTEIRNDIEGAVKQKIETEND